MPDRRTSNNPLARTWRWLDSHDYVWDTKVRGRAPSVFETYTWKRVLPAYLVLVAAMAVFNWHWSRQDMTFEATMGGFSVWALTFSALGKGRPEHSRAELNRACWIATAVVIACAAAGHFVIVSVFDRDLDWGYYFGILISIAVSVVSVRSLANRHAADRGQVAEAAARQQEVRANREADARMLAEARLGVLQAQIEPHFIFNCLAHLQELIAEDPHAAQAMTGALTRYLRQAIPDRRDLSSTLGRELDLARAYLDIMKLRMGDRLRYTLDADKDLLEISFPPLILATLIENAIRHGLEPKPGGGRVDVTATGKAGRLVVAVRDDGVGLASAPTSGTGVGLANSRDRLTAIYGEEADLEIAPGAPDGCIATVTVPWRAH